MFPTGLSPFLPLFWYIQEVLPALTQLSFPSIHFIPSLSVSVAAFLLSSLEAALFGPRPNATRVLHSPVHQRQSSFANSLLLLVLSYCCWYSYCCGTLTAVDTLFCRWYSLLLLILLLLMLTACCCPIPWSFHHSRSLFLSIIFVTIFIVTTNHHQ